MEEYVEVGLGNAPTLANLGAKTLHLPEFAGNDTVVYNVGRDEGRVYMTDTDSLVPDDEPEEAAAWPRSKPLLPVVPPLPSSVPVPLRQMP